jgi:peptidylprolyl isomerase
MNLFNKYELVGILFSIAIMALALGVVRFKTDTFLAESIPEGETQGAVVAVSGDVKDDDAALEQTLKDSFSLDGTLLNLVVDDVRIGTGEAVENGDKVTVHYVGTLQDGTRFDSSYDRGEPFYFTVGKGNVIAGWEKGLIGMKVGGQRILVIPGDMAYGNRQVGVIPANATLVFAIELLKIE